MFRPVRLAHGERAHDCEAKESYDGRTKADVDGEVLEIGELRGTLEYFVDVFKDERRVVSELQTAKSRVAKRSEERLRVEDGS